MGAHSAGRRDRGRHQAPARRPSGAGPSVALTAALAVGALGVVSVEATGARPAAAPPGPPASASPAARPDGFPQPGPVAGATGPRARAVPASIGTPAALGPLEVLVTGIRLLDQEGTEGSGTRLAVDLRITNGAAVPATSPWAEIVCGRSVGAVDRQSTLPPGTELRPQETGAGALVVGVPVARCSGGVLRLVGAAASGAPAPVLVLAVPTGTAQDFSR